MLTGGDAAFSTMALPVGADVITAVYSGDTSFATSTSAAVSVVVAKDHTMTSASAVAELRQRRTDRDVLGNCFGQCAGSGTPTGSVDFFDATTNTDLTPGGVSLSSGTASFATTSLSTGPHTIKATYSGDGNFLSSSATAGTSRSANRSSSSTRRPAAPSPFRQRDHQLPGGVYVDSSSSSAISASGNSQIKASVIDVHGGVQKSGNASFSPAPTTGAAIARRPAGRWRRRALPA